jgi:hypothetical protein
MIDLETVCQNPVVGMRFPPSPPLHREIMHAQLTACTCLVAASALEVHAHRCGSIQTPSPAASAVALHRRRQAFSRAQLQGTSAVRDRVMFAPRRTRMRHTHHRRHESSVPRVESAEAYKRQDGPVPRPRGPRPIRSASDVCRGNVGLRSQSGASPRPHQGRFGFRFRTP